MTPRQVLQRRLRDIDKRRAEIAVRLKTLTQDSYERQELQAEHIDLGRWRQVTENELRGLKARPGQAKVDAEQRRQQTIDAWEREQRANILHTVEQFEKQGDFRNARVWRMELMKLREQLEQQVR